MSEHPILFSGPMVRAILAGRKTQTRRLVTVPWARRSRTLPFSPYYEEEDGKLFTVDEYGDWHDFATYVACPHGQPGDRLWVKETWAPILTYCKDDADGWAIEYAADGARRELSPPFGWREREWTKGPREVGRHYGWRPSIFMPRWASRLSLGLTAVRVERLQDLTGEDAIAEGVTLPPGGKAETLAILRDARLSFAALWDAINGKRPGASWAANPWVWVESFAPVLP